MNFLVITTCSLIILSSCSDTDSKEKIEMLDDTYELIEIDSYNFRRDYHGRDTLAGEELNLFINRNPEPTEEYTNSEIHPLYHNLSEIGLIKDGDLNIADLDTLPGQFNYQVSHNIFFTVRSKLLEDPEKVKTPSYELTFMYKEKTLLIDTLEFDWPADVSFLKSDIDKDGTEELISVFRSYIVNGDNFDLKIYKLKK